MKQETVEKHTVIEDGEMCPWSPDGDNQEDSFQQKMELFVKTIWWWIASKYRRFKIWILNPSRLLRWMLVALFVLFAGMIALNKGYFDNFSWAPTLKEHATPSDWVTATGIYFAVSGWIVNAIVTMRNSVKQHSINTLLQSRLSKTYMDEAHKARDILSDYSPERPAPAKFIQEHGDQYSVDFILNYIEFMAVGIKHGDLHEDVMKDSMRGIVIRFTAITMPYIQATRKTHGHRTFENLMWIRKRWGG